MDTIKKVFYWIEVFGKYGNAISKTALFVRDQLHEIHPELFNEQLKEAENENS